MNTQTTTTSIERRQHAAESQMAMIMAIEARLAVAGDERAQKMRELLKARVAEERARALALLEDEIRLAFQ